MGVGILWLPRQLHKSRDRAPGHLQRLNYYHEGMANIQIETDSQKAMELIREGVKANSQYKALIEDASVQLKPYLGKLIKV